MIYRAMKTERGYVLDVQCDKCRKRYVIPWHRDGGDSQVACKKCKQPQAVTDEDAGGKAWN